MLGEKIVLVMLILSSYLSAIKIKNCTNALMVISPKHNSSKILLIKNNEIMRSRYLCDMIIFLYSQKTDAFFPGKKFEVSALKFHNNKRYNAYFDEVNLSSGNASLRFFNSEGGKSIKFDEVPLTNLQS